MSDAGENGLDEDAIDELPLVLGEISAVMRARGAALTLHPDDGDRPQVVYADRGAALTHDMIDRLLGVHIDWTAADRPDAHRWVACHVDEPCQDVMLIPVQTIPGHSRLLISVYFDDLSAQRRAEAEAVYAQRKPFAIGYFRLWQLARTRRGEIGALKAALNLTEMSVMLVNRAGQLIFANRAAREMLDYGGGLRLHKNAVRAAHLRDSVRLQMAIEHVIAANDAAPAKPGPVRTRKAPLLSLERDDLPPVIVSVLPAEQRAREPYDVAAIIYALDPSRSVEEMLKPICQIYRLSPVESRLTCLLASGITLAEAAGRMRVKEMTARSYLKQIFIKTNTHRQGELMQLMLSSVMRTSSAVTPEPLQAV